MPPDWLYMQLKTNYSMLDKLKEMTGGDEQRLKTYISIYLEVMPEYCERLEKAIKETDIGHIRDIVHSSKPLLPILGLDQIYNLADNLESQIDEKRSQHEILLLAGNLLEEMIATFQQFKKEA